MNAKLLGQLFLTFAKVGVMTFGGGMAMLPILQREVVEDKGWATDEAGRPVHIVSPVRRIGQHERVADMHPVGRNARRQNVPVLRIQTAERQQCEQPYRKTWFLHIKKRVG